MVLWKFKAPEKGDARGVRQEWLGGWGSTLLETKGNGTEGGGVLEEITGRGITLEMAINQRIHK